MKRCEIKAKIALGKGKKISGQIEVLKCQGEKPPSFRNLPKNLKGKILVCPGEVFKSLLEKSMALGVYGVVADKIADESLLRLEKELKTSWSPATFALLIVEEEIDWNKFEGKLGTIEVKEKRLVIELT